MNARIFFFTLALSFGVVGLAFAQSLSGKGNNEQVTDQGCEAEVAIVSDGVAALRAKIEAILNCHAQWKMYNVDTDSCIDPRFPTYTFSNVGTEIHIQFEGEKVGDTLTAYNIRGPKGLCGQNADINGCGLGYQGSALTAMCVNP